jgi:hypothetical protein
MKVFKTLLTVVLVVGVLGAAAYGGGYLIRHHDQTRASASPGTSTPQVDPATPSSPATDPTPPPTAPSTHHAPAPVLSPGAKGTEVRELQQRLFQLAWLPENLHRGVRRRHGQRGPGLPGQARAEGDRRRGPSYLAAAGGDDRAADP